MTSYEFPVLRQCKTLCDIVKDSKTMKGLYILIISAILFSCSEDFEQSYNNFSELDQTNLRLKGWFPDFIDSNCYNLKECHSIEINSSFGKFLFKKEFRVDSLLSFKNGYEETSLDSINIFLETIKKPKRPSWFLHKETMPGNSFYKKDKMYFIKNSKENAIYFAYSTE